MIPMHSLPRRGSAQRQSGFSLVELSVVLIVIGLVLGAVAVGRDLQRSAANQRLSTDFIQGWQLAYEAYFNGVGRPPGDNPANPTGRVNGDVTPAGSELCGATMINAFLAAGIRVPTALGGLDAPSPPPLGDDEVSATSGRYYDLTVVPQYVIGVLRLDPTTKLEGW